jgi:hypothetical protein
MQVEQRHAQSSREFFDSWPSVTVPTYFRAALAEHLASFEASLPPPAPVDAGGGNKGLREALQGLLTLVDGCLTAEMIAEGMHAGLRKGSDAPDAAALWRAIADSKTSAWSDAARFAVDPFFTMWGKKALADARSILATPSVIAESTSNDCLLVAEAVRERCAGIADHEITRIFSTTPDGRGSNAARRIRDAIRSLDLSGVGVG